MSSIQGSAFSASYDITTKAISAIACLVLIGAAVTAGSLALACLALAVIVLSFAFSPRGYIVSREAVFIKRLIGSVEIPLFSLRDARAAVSDDLRGCIRVFGNGGLFGYYGLYRTSRLGMCRWYVTQRNHGVILVTGSKTVVVSPDDVDGFVNTIRDAAAMVPGRVHPPGERDLRLIRTERRRALIWILVASAIGVLVIGLGAAALLYSPGPPGYTISSDTLTIHDRFYPVTVKAAEINIEGIRILDISSDPYWRPTSRTNGFANSHYRSGWFRVAGGEKVRMYRAEDRRLVLLPPKKQGTAVLIEARQPEAFIRELRAAWQ